MNNIDTGLTTESIKIFEKTILGLQENHYRYSFFSLMRRLDASGCFDDDFDAKGNIKKVRLGQEPSFRFPTSSIQSIKIKEDTLQVFVNGFGMLGVNSPLPLHFVEYIFNRKHQFGDDTWVAFINLIQHRLLQLFYEAWKNAQIVTSLEKQNENKFSNYVASLIGLQQQVKKPFETNISMYSKLYYAGFLFGQKASPKNITSVISQYFDVPCKLFQNIGKWVLVDKTDIQALGNQKNMLGQGVFLGNRIFDAMSHFRLSLGPLTYNEYCSFFADRDNAKKIKEWLEVFIGIEYEWDIQLILKRDEVPKLGLNAKQRLGQTTWLGLVDSDADDYVVKYTI